MTGRLPCLLAVVLVCCGCIEAQRAMNGESVEYTEPDYGPVQTENQNTAEVSEGEGDDSNENDEANANEEENTNEDEDTNANGEENENDNVDDEYDCALDPFNLADAIPALEEDAEVITTDTGLCYIDIEVGEGRYVHSEPLLQVYYTGWLEDGTVFDSLAEPADPFQFEWNAGTVIAGFDEGVEGMYEGGVRRLIIPPHLGYGSTGAGAIPPDAILIFDIEMYNIIHKNASASETDGAEDAEESEEPEESDEEPVTLGPDRVRANTADRVGPNGEEPLFASNPPDGIEAEYSWTVLSGDATIDDETARETSITVGGELGDVTAQVTMTVEVDGTPQVFQDEVDIQIVPDDALRARITGPTEAAVGEQITLTASFEGVPAGGGVQHTWEVLEGEGEFVDATQRIVEFTPLSEGDVVVQVTAQRVATTEIGPDEWKLVVYPATADSGEGDAQTDCALDPFDPAEDIPPLEEDAEVITSDTGLCYIDLEVGDGVEVADGATVQMYYTGYLEDGTVFDSLTSPADPFEFAWNTGRVIAGFDEGVGGMYEGGRRRLIIPSDLGYGESGAGSIPANATLIFDVEVVGVIY